MQRLKRQAVWGFCAAVLVAAALVSQYHKGDVAYAVHPGEVKTPLIPTTGDPPCQFVDNWILYHDGSICVEMVYDNVTPPEAAPALMGLAFSPDGTLYFARTAFGELWAMRDQDGDHFFDTLNLVADDLRLPSGITVYEEALYVFSGDGIIRFDAVNREHLGKRTPLVTDLPLHTGFWAGSVSVGPDERLYIGLGSGCDTCNEEEQRGVLLSYNLDGSDKQVVATGFRNPADFAWHPVTGDLWSVDTGRVTTDVNAISPPDELNLVQSGKDYGFPACYGRRIPDPEWVPSRNNCADTKSPHLLFPYQSNPFGMVFYTGDAFPAWKNDSIVVLRGSWDLPEPAGYSLSVVDFSEKNRPTGWVNPIVPHSTHSSYAGYSLAQYSLLGFGFFPYHPLDVVVSPEGWLYVSIEEGRIIRLRPNPE
jgi:glucose/arabinose dehydrogenase